MHTTQFSTGRRPAQILLVTVFLAAIALPLAHRALVGQAADESVEQRRLAALPPAPQTAQDVRTYPLRFEAFFNDQFGLRQDFIRLYNLAQVKWLGMPIQSGNADSLLAGGPRNISNQVIVGREGWLFYSGERVIDDYRCTRPFSAEDLATWRNVLQERHDWLAAQGIRYVVVVIPNKETMYGRYLPASISKIGAESRLDQLANKLKAESSVELVDLRTALEESAATCRTYHRTDTHWNHFGAYVAYTQIMSRLGEEQSRACRPLDQFRIERRQGPGGDLANMLGLRDLLTEEFITLEPIQPRHAEGRPPRGQGKSNSFHRPDGQGPRLVVFHDSFIQQLAPFLSEHFSEAHYVWTREFQPDVIVNHAPAIVIQEYGERLLQHDLPTNPTDLSIREPQHWAGQDRERMRR